MSAIKRQSTEIAKEEACRLWAYCGAQYVNDDFLLKEIGHQVLRSISSFSLAARRVLESYPKDHKFSLNSSPWSRGADNQELSLESDLWESLNLVIHARELRVMFGTLTEGTYVSPSMVVTHAMVSTDRKADRAIQPFAMAYAFLAHVQPSKA